MPLTLRIENVKCNDIGVVISHFCNNSKDYLAVVNHYPFSSQNVTILAKNNYRIYQLYVSPDIGIDKLMNESRKPPYGSETSPLTPTPEAGIEAKVCLPPGGIAIFHLY